jgi:PTS system nitrogen regulatory IIA component
MVLTIEEVAIRLNVPVETVHRWIRQGKIPMQSSQGGHTIRQEMFERWVTEHQMKVSDAPVARDNLPKTEVDEAPRDLVLPAMKIGGIFYGLDGDTKEEVLTSAMDVIPNLQEEQRPIILEKLLEREQMASTGIGYGIALPHPRANPDVPLERPQITTCFTTRPIPFAAIDQKPVSVLMILLSSSTKEHLSLLSKLAFYLRDAGFREQLLSAPAQETIFELIDRMESSGH